MTARVEVCGGGQEGGKKKTLAEFKREARKKGPRKKNPQLNTGGKGGPEET